MNSESPTPIATTERWDLTIRPKTGWFDLHLSDLWRYRDLTLLFVWRDFVAQYKQTVLGPLWYLIQALFTTAIFTLIFGRVAKLSTDSLPPVLFYMAGVTCWNYFAECLNRTSGTFIQNAGMFGKVYFPRLCVPVSVIISNIIRFGIQFALFLTFMGFYYVQGAAIHPNIYVLLIPILLLIMAALGLGVGIIVHRLPSSTAISRCWPHLVSNCSCMSRQSFIPSRWFHSNTAGWSWRIPCLRWSRPFAILSSARAPLTSGIFFTALPPP